MTQNSKEGNESRSAIAFDWSDRPIFWVLQRLNGVAPNDPGFQAQCPAHSDRTPSLSISENENGRVLIHCHAGCHYEDVLDAIDLDWQFLEPKLRAGNRRAFRPTPEFFRASSPVSNRNLLTPDFTSTLRHFQQFLNRRHLANLSVQLGLPPSVFGVFDLGYHPCDLLGECFVIPEFNAAGTPIGLLRRFLDGSKKAMQGSRRGLTVPRGCFERQGPVLIPEGFSDTAALTHSEFAAIGRPSATGGVEHLAELLVHCPRKIVVIGENDSHDDGRWPGRDGAESVAHQLALRMDREVSVLLPPPNFKDARSLLCAGGANAIYQWLCR